MHDRPKLKVIAVAGHLVNDDLALQANERWRFVGRSPVKVSPPEGYPGFFAAEAAYPPQECEYPDSGENRYILAALRRGALKPLDAYTAKRASVPFKSATDAAVKPAKGQKAEG